MKNLLNILLLSVLLIATGCSSNKGKLDSIAKDMAEAQLSGYSSNISKVEKEMKSFGKNLSDEERDECEDYWPEAMGKGFMNALNEELSNIASNIDISSYRVKSAYEKYEEKIEKVDKDYKKFTQYALTLYLGEFFNDELNGYAKAVFDAVKKNNDYDLKNADKEFVKKCEKLEEEAPKVVLSLREAYRKVLEKGFENYLEDSRKELEKVLKSGDQEKIAKWREDQIKQTEKLFSKASNDVQAAYSSTCKKIESEASATFKEKIEEQ